MAERPVAWAKKVRRTPPPSLNLSNQHCALYLAHALCSKERPATYPVEHSAPLSMLQRHSLLIAYPS